MLVHKDLGFQEESAFLEILTDALNPSKEYYPLLNAYQRGEKDYESRQYLIKMTRKLGNRNLAKEMTKDYVDNYLYFLKENERFTDDRLRLIASVMLHSNDKGFGIFLKNEREVNRTVGEKDYAFGILEPVVYREEIDSAVTKCLYQLNKAPDWKEMYRTVKRKYSSRYARNVVLDGEIRWYKQKEDWNQLAKYLVNQYEIQRIDTSGGGLLFLNNNLWIYVFEHCDDEKTLKKASKLEKIAIRLRPKNSDYLDTYANLLYRRGHTSEELLLWESKALKVSPANTRSSCYF